MHGLKPGLLYSRIGWPLVVRSTTSQLREGEGNSITALISHIHDCNDHKWQVLDKYAINEMRHEAFLKKLDSTFVLQLGMQHQIRRLSRRPRYVCDPICTFFGTAPPRFRPSLQRPVPTPPLPQQFDLNLSGPRKVLCYLQQISKPGNHIRPHKLLTWQRLK